MCFLFSIPWTIGALIDPDGRDKFDSFFKQLLLSKNEDFPLPKIVGKVEPMFPDRDTIYDYMPEVCGFGYFIAGY